MSDATNKTPVGIDLGTTFSAVSYLDSDGRPVTVPNSCGDLLTPTAMLVEDGAIIVGKEAVKSSAISPEAFADCFKRDMGADQFRKDVASLTLPPEVLSAFILERLKQDAEKKLGHRVQDVVVTVPAFFDETRRKATQDAGRLAGLNVLDIINEPTAAAVAFGYDLSRSQNDSEYENGLKVLVYDLGGGTFDVTLLNVNPRELKTIATDGDVRLGGKDFDERIVNYLAEKFKDEHGLDPRSDLSDAAQLWMDAQEAKHALSERNRTTVVCYHSGMRVRVEITRDQFEQLTQDLLERTETTTSLLLEHANLDWSDLDEILVVGGSSRMPQVIEMITRLTGRPPSQVLSADEAVAHGAAIYCGSLQKEGTQAEQQQKLINVNSHSLGVTGLNVKSNTRVNRVLIPKNTPLPCHVTKVFPTARKGQRSVLVQVVEGESVRPEECIALGQCVVQDLPPGLPAGTKVEVRYSYKSDGRISVSARVPDTRQSATVDLQRKRAVQLGDLETWRTRICDPQGSSIKESSPSSNSPPSLTAEEERLKQIGKTVVKLANPPKVLRRQIEAIRAKWESYESSQKHIQELELSSETTGSAEAIRITAALAKANQEVVETRKVIQIQLIELGRICSEQQVAIPELADLVRSVQTTN